MNIQQIEEALNKTPRFGDQKLTVDESASWASDAALTKVIEMDESRARDGKRVVRLFTRSLQLFAIWHGEFVQDGKYWWQAWDADKGHPAFHYVKHSDRAAETMEACIISAIATVEFRIECIDLTGAAFYEPDGRWAVTSISKETRHFMEATYGTAGTNEHSHIVFPMLTPAAYEFEPAKNMLHRMMRNRGIEPAEQV